MKSYVNPLRIEIGDRARSFKDVPYQYNPDPYILKYNGRYYAYATAAAGVTVMQSEDLVSWTHGGFAFTYSGEFDYWAPAVFYDNGKFYMYYSSREGQQEDVHYEFMKAAVSDTPEGPFVYAKTLFEFFTIDAHVVRDAQGELYLFYSTNETVGTDRERPGTVILADRLIDPLTPEGNPRLVVKPTIDEEIYEENRFGDGRDWHTIEGAFYLKRRDRHYVMYSGNAFTRPTYYIGYSSAQDKPGAGLSELDWMKYPDEDTFRPLLMKNEEVSGVGHNSVAKAPNNVDDWVIYHGRFADVGPGPVDTELRQMRMDPLVWLGERMFVPGPTSTEQPAPALPSFADSFARSDQAGLGGGWETAGGEFALEGREAVQLSRIGRAAALVPGTYDCALFEANLRWLPNHMGGLYGIIAAYLDEANYTEVLLDRGKRTISAVETVNGVRRTAASAQVHPRFRFEAYHQLLLRKSGAQYAVELDGVRALSFRSRHSGGRLGVCTHSTAIRFAGIAVTRHLAMEAGNAEAAMSSIAAEQGSWTLEGDTLSGEPTGGAAALTLRKPEGMGGAAVRFDVSVKRSSAPSAELAIRLDGLADAQRIKLPHRKDAVTEHTVTILHTEGFLQIRLNEEVLFRGDCAGELVSISLTSEGRYAVSALEWTGQ
ncbi:glycoside hydrolase family 43 protein [Paenibacillus gansuensis]|uniref:Glycoside hydrolase family 43 protein n=1 Tax=Paenibacillus gansuensis TaxID=306542 RepID=A0ABW5P9J4_9BACL